MEFGIDGFWIIVLDGCSQLVVFRLLLGWVPGLLMFCFFVGMSFFLFGQHCQLVSTILDIDLTTGFFTRIDA